ncbi:MAG: DEAD/DEAH box helicase family protein [Phycisphaerales bacterium]
MARRATTTATPRSSRKAERMPFHHRLVLNRWMLHLFEVESFEELQEQLRDPRLEGLESDGVSRFHRRLISLFERKHLSVDQLLQYDQNILRHTVRLNQRRPETIQWRYFQYLTLLFTEVYLDRFFANPEQMLAELNDFAAEYNADKAEQDKIDPFQPGDLRKIAFWNATGSGKTLLMHINLEQYRHYLDRYKGSSAAKAINRIILLTPNEGLSRQHLEEFRLSGIQAELFDKDGRGLFAGRAVEIIDIHKLASQEDSGGKTIGEKRVAVEAFEDNNLVLVDEGHRGASSQDVSGWMKLRNQLCLNGFSFEYSATFGQAMRAANNLELEQTYAKCILFDYSYKYFYRDGFGKEYSILNLAEDKDEQRRQYLTACLLAFYQQQRIFAEKEDKLHPFQIERPLWVFVGGKVTAVRTEEGRKVSDVTDILLFLAEFIKDRPKSERLLKGLLSGRTGLTSRSGTDLFATAFTYLVKQKTDPASLFDDILQTLFNAPTTGKLHVELLKGSDGEIALRVGENKPFGVINVGDASALHKLCEEYGDALAPEEKDFTDSLFASIGAADSTINMLIGSKKFSEGWNSWRVSTMGLMNIGKSEGSEIIQLFGRGVRLKGYEKRLRRSNSEYAAIPGDLLNPVREHLQPLETLNVFGVRADYMQRFQEYLEAEGLPNPETREEIILPVWKTLPKTKLRLPDLPKDQKDAFRRHGPRPRLDKPTGELAKRRVLVNWYPRIQAERSKGYAGGAVALPTVPHEDSLGAQHIAFMDLDRIYFELQQFKNERGWFNLAIPREVISGLLSDSSWYTLQIPKEALEFTDFGRVRRWEEIAVALLKKYIERYYIHNRGKFEQKLYRYRDVSPEDDNFPDAYRILVDKSQKEIIENLHDLTAAIKTHRLDGVEFGEFFKGIMFGQHLYQPLLHFSDGVLKSGVVEVSPVSLNKGEKDFVGHLAEYFSRNKKMFKDRELYLLRNLTRGRGVGFFEAGNFYPDFVLWVVDGKRQLVSFIDPKGLMNLQGRGDDPKIEFYKSIKQIEADLGDASVTLNSFIISTTSLGDLWGWKLTKEQFEDHHVLFQEDGGDVYLGKLFARLKIS